MGHAKIGVGDRAGGDGPGGTRRRGGIVVGMSAARQKMIACVPGYATTLDRLPRLGRGIATALRLAVRLGDVSSI